MVMAGSVDIWRSTEGRSTRSICCRKVRLEVLVEDDDASHIVDVLVSAATGPARSATGRWVTPVKPWCGCAPGSVAPDAEPQRVKI